MSNIDNTMAVSTAELGGSEGLVAKKWESEFDRDIDRILTYGANTMADKLKLCHRVLEMSPVQFAVVGKMASLKEVAFAVWQRTEIAQIYKAEAATIPLLQPEEDDLFHREFKKRKLAQSAEEEFRERVMEYQDDDDLNNMPRSWSSNFPCRSQDFDPSSFHRVRHWYEWDDLQEADDYNEPDPWDDYTDLCLDNWGYDKDMYDLQAELEERMELEDEMLKAYAEDAPN